MTTQRGISLADQLLEEAAEPDVIAGQSKRVDRIYTSERSRLNQAIEAEPTLSGNEFVPSLGAAINKISTVLANQGFSLDLVSADTIRGRGGRRDLTFRRAHREAFSEHPEIENAVIVFTWENLSPPEPGGVERKGSFEVVAYVS